MSEIKIANGKVEVDGEEIKELLSASIWLSGDPDSLVTSDIEISYSNKEKLEEIKQKYEIEELTVIAKAKKIMP